MSDVGLDTGSGRGQGSRPKRIRGCLAVLIALAVLGGGAGFAVVQGRQILEGLVTTPPADYTGNGQGSVLVEIEEGDTAADIGALLERKDVVKTEAAFYAAAANDERSRLIQVGFYRLHKQMSAAAALAMLLDPKSRVGSSVTVPEGLRLTEVVDALSSQTRFSSVSLNRALRDVKQLALPSYAGGDPEGYLFPATYEINPDTTAGRLLRSMVARFKEAAAAVGLQQRADALGVTPAEAVVVASLVQAEARRPQDLAKVATVIYNRLEIDEPLGLDSTVHYAVESTGEVFTTDEMRAVDSPYNTYTNVGLPPGPINSPGEDALRAALNPAQGDWIYFVTVNLNTGETKFADDAAEHAQNTNELLQWCYAHDGRC